MECSPEHVCCLPALSQKILILERKMSNNSWYKNIGSTVYTFVNPSYILIKIFVWSFNQILWVKKLFESVMKKCDLTTERRTPEKTKVTPKCLPTMAGDTTKSDMAELSCFSMATRVLHGFQIFKPFWERTIRRRKMDTGHPTIRKAHHEHYAGYYCHPTEHCERHVRHL